MTIYEKKKAVAYCRVSSKEQEAEGYSLDAQEKIVVEYARRNNIEIQTWYTEAETAKTSGREQFNQMVKFLNREAKSKKKNRCQIVLVEKTDRLYRNFKDYVGLDPNELDIEIHFVKDRTLISKDSGSNEKLTHGFKVLLAKNFSDNLSEETRKGLLAKAEQGLYPGAAPVGYLNVQDEQGRRIIVLD